MAWTTPAVRATGDLITAAIWNADIKDNLRYLKGMDGVSTVESGLIIDNSGGDEYLRIPALTTAQRNALTPAEGMLIWNTSKDVLEVYTGAAWVEMPAPVVDAAQGDVLYRGASAWARLAAGTSGQFLKTLGAGANPAWSSLATVSNTGSYTGDDAQNRAIAHGLGVVPKLVVIVGETTNLWHLLINANAYIYSQSGSTISRVSVTAPDATNFYVGDAPASTAGGNWNTAPYVWSAIG